MKDNENKKVDLLEELTDSNEEITNLIEKYDAESRYRTLKGLPGKLISLWLAAMSLFHLATAGLVTMPLAIQRAVHLTFSITAVFILYPATRRGAKDRTPWYDWLLAAAGQYRTAALMHLSTLTEEGRFDNARSTLILEDADAQDALVQSILETVQARHYFGLDVDFEYVLPEQREAYAAFITRLREALNPLGCPVVVALAPKTSAAQRGLLYEAHDYALLSAAANAVFLMTYEWGYAYGPPMAVAPLGQVRAVLDYALTAVAPEKIFVGIPLYGYDWPLPFVSGKTRAESLSPVQAVERALRHDIAIQYDAAAQAPYYHYTDRGGREHAVWFEDARSIEAKLRLADEYHLQGVGYWNLTRPFPQNWAVLASLFDIETLL